MTREAIAIAAGALLVSLFGCGNPSHDHVESTGGLPTGGIGTGGIGTGGIVATGGTLTCGAGQADCGGGFCRDVTSDVQNCGQCGQLCGTGQLCQSGVCTCGAGLQACPSGCVDTLTSPTNCGTCGNACAAGQACTNGQCACQAGLENCGAGCVDTRTTAASCGLSCATAVPCMAPTPYCSQGACTAACAAGETSCDSSCVNILTDQSNCGSCGNACPAGQSCSNGNCGCPTGQLDCGAGCVDTLSNPSDCGSCGIVCGGGQQCVSGQCTCPPGQINCGGSCVTGTSCPCSPACAVDETCTNGTCVCNAGLTDCSGTCTDITSDPANCNGCGLACTGGKTCSGSACVCPAGQEDCNGSCVAAGTCATACNPACTGSKECVNGACACPATAPTDCNGSCADLTTSATHCGECGNACSGGQVCLSSTCACPAGQEDCGDGTCVAAGSCNSCGPGQIECDGVCVEGTTCGECNRAAGMVSDFEEGAGDPVVIAQDGRTGAWERFWQEDGFTASSFTMAVESSGNSDECDQYALHAQGTAGDWGDWVGIGIYFGQDKSNPVPYNGNKYTGIRFKAKKGSGHDQHSAVRFNISIPQTEGTGSGGDCSDAAGTSEKAARPCYQHLGRFLQVESDIDSDNELSTSWKEFTYCFDRDLYPLSLPSNVTNAQRVALPSNILKFQFQFNKGKDWYRGFVAESDYQDMASNLSFDFWVDDLEFISGDCPNTDTFQSSAGTAKPFPQNANIGTCAPGAPGAPATAFNRNISRIYAQWTKNFVRTDGSNLKVIAPEQEGGVTTSEAMGYGMLIAAAMGDKDTFEKFWGYVNSGGRISNGLMSWKGTGQGSATDGDLDIAYALKMAEAQWGTHGSDATAMINAIKSRDVTSNRLKPGDGWDGGFNASYFAPSYMRAFGSDWSSVISTNYSLVQSDVTAATSGIPTDWATTSGSPAAPGSVGAQVTSFTSVAFGYDAARVPWRIGLDGCMAGGTGSTLAGTIVSYFATKYDGGDTIDLLKAGWNKSSGQPCTSSSDGKDAADFQGSFIGPMGVGAMAANNAKVRDRAFRAMLDILESPDFNQTYFPSTVGVISLLIMSGNFPTP